MQTTSADNMLVTVRQASEIFTVPPGTLRAWIASGELVPVRRAGRGRGGACYVTKGSVAGLVYGLCPVCAQGFKRARQSQKFCSTRCRQRPQKWRANSHV